MLHANEHAPTKWPANRPVSSPLPRSLPTPHLAALTLLPAVFRLTHPPGNMQGLSCLCTPRETFI